MFLGEPGDLRGYDYMEGHWSLPTILHAFDAADVVCVVREPRARLLSHYTFWRSWPQWMHDLWTPYDAAGLAQLRLSEFLSDPRAAHQADNLCTRLLLGEHPLCPPDGFISDVDTAAALACERIDSLGYTDLLERGEAMYTGLEQWFGSRLSRERLNETDLTGGRPVEVDDAVTRTTMELLHARTAADRAVWRHVAARRGLTETAADELADTVFAAAFGRIVAEHTRLAVAPPAGPAGPAPAAEPGDEPADAPPAPPAPTTAPVAPFGARLVAFARRGPRAWVDKARRLVS